MDTDDVAIRWRTQTPGSGLALPCGRVPSQAVEELLHHVALAMVRWRNVSKKKQSSQAGIGILTANKTRLSSVNTFRQSPANQFPSNIHPRHPRGFVCRTAHPLVA